MTDPTRQLEAALAVLAALTLLSWVRHGRREGDPRRSVAELPRVPLGALCVAALYLCAGLRPELMVAVAFASVVAMGAAPLLGGLPVAVMLGASALTIGHNFFHALAGLGVAIATVTAYLVWDSAREPLRRRAGWIALLCVLVTIPDPGRHGSRLLSWVILLGAGIGFVAVAIAVVVPSSGDRRLPGWTALSAALLSTSDAVERVTTRVDRRITGIRTLGPLERPVRWFAKPTATSDRAPGRWTSGPWSYVVPIGTWLVVNLAVRMVATIHSIGIMVGVRSPGWAFLHPFDATGRIGWGTGDYWAVADHGYLLSERREAVFPVVPLLVRWVTATGMHIGDAQVLVASVSGFLATILFWALAGRLGVTGTRRVVALLLFCLFPWNVFLYGIAYADPTTLACILGAFLLVELGWSVAAGLVGAVATATRPNSIPLPFALLAYELGKAGTLVRRRTPADGDAPPQWWRLDRRVQVTWGRLRPMQWGVLLSLGGVGAYSVWCWVHAGDPLYWLTAQGYYGHDTVTALNTWLKGYVVTNPLGVTSNRWWTVNEVVTFVILVGAVPMIRGVWRRFGTTYGIFTLGVWLIAWTGGRAFAPGARYLLPALPFLAMLAAEWLTSRRRLIVPVFATFLFGFFVFVLLFSGQTGLWLEW